MGRVLGMFAYRTILPSDGTTRSRSIAFSAFTYSSSDGTDSRQLDGEMGEEDLLGTLPLLLSGGNFVGLQFPLLEVWHGVDDDPRYATSKVYNLGVRRRQQTPLARDVLLTSCNKKLMRPVAMIGFSIQMYHAAQNCSSQLRLDRSRWA
jgi:hypothetical protein